MRKAVRDFERQIANEAKANTKAFYKYAKSKMKTRSTVADFERPDGTMTETDVDKAEILNNDFTSVFTQESLENIPTFERTLHNTEELTDFMITDEKVENILKTLKTPKPPGPDGLHPRPLVGMVNELVEPFRELFAKSLDEGALPQCWKEGNITPVFKKGKKHIPGNYRPVSLTSVACKMMEQWVRNEVMEHMLTNNLLSSFQDGFGRSCTTQLLAVLDKWTEAIEQGESIDAIYLDFAKAFDKVPHHSSKAQRLWDIWQSATVDCSLPGWKKPKCYHQW